MAACARAETLLCSGLLSHWIFSNHELIRKVQTVTMENNIFRDKTEQSLVLTEPKWVGSETTNTQSRQKTCFLSL